MRNYPYRIFLFGEDDCGQISLVNRIINNSFSETMPTKTLGLYTKNIFINGKSQDLDIWNISEWPYRRCYEKVCKKADFILLMYNIKYRSTFNQKKEYHYETMKNLAKLASINIFYNKL